MNIRVGSFLEPAEKTGLAALTGAMMRTGGAANMTAEQFDERADFLAADLFSYVGESQGGASVNCLSSVLGPSLDLLFDMLRAPRFQQDRVDIEKSSRLEEMKQRNDDAGDILNREWSWLLYGEAHFSSRQATKQALDSITREDMADFHHKYWRPQSMILSVAGDVNTRRVLADLEKRFAGWNVQGPAVGWPPPASTFTPKPGLYHVEKDIPQGKVYIGQLSTKWDRYDNPDNYALMVMNDILGGGGFTSRITKKVRSDEGLAYSAGSRYNIGTYYPLDYRVSFQSKNPTVALAAKLSLEEVVKLKGEKVSADELKTAKGSFIDAYPRNFDSPARVAGLFAADEYMGRPHSYWVNYRDNIRKVTADDVQRVAKKYLADPDKVVFLVVGKWSEIENGDANHRATMQEFFGGQVVNLPLRDPLTLKPMQ
jgi:predicted Zn-dependent peptidase